MSDEIARFYDALSDTFHLVHPDWRESVRRQGEALDALIARSLGEPGPRRILDCSCGIGTQAIGLALRGHRVLGTDLSAAALARASREAASLGVELDTAVADMRQLEAATEESFDVVISCDNSVAHLAPDELEQAFRSMRAALRPEGLLLVSLRDYDRLVEERPDVMSAVVQPAPGGRRISFQVWAWDDDGGAYTMDQFLVAERSGRLETARETTRLFAHRRDAVIAGLARAGLADARWLLPAESGYVQPVATARRTG